jgi:hypothetical protein
VQSNDALGGVGGERNDYFSTLAGNGGDALGGGIAVGAGAVTISRAKLLANMAVAGNGGNGFEKSGGMGGEAFGGGLYAGGGALTLTNDAVSGNEALEGVQPGNTFPGLVGPTAGGGIEIASAATVSLDSFTVNNTTNNYIGVPIFFVPLELSNIDGKYDLLP